MEEEKARKALEAQVKQEVSKPRPTLGIMKTPTIIEQAEPPAYEKSNRPTGGVQFNTSQLTELREMSEPSETTSGLDLLED